MMSLDEKLGMMFRGVALENEMDKRVRSLIGRVPDVHKAQAVINKKRAGAIEEIKRQLSAGVTSITCNENKLFKEIFAHKRCYALVDGLQSFFDQDDEMRENSGILALIDDKGEPAHWLVTFSYAGNTYYSDAYGIFSELSDITSRYEDTTIVKSVPFEIGDDENPLYEKYTDLNCSVFDDLEGVIGELHGEHLELDDKIGYMELYYDKEVLQCISPTIRKECDTAP